ncbi:MAG: hypothetical protein ABH861_04875 [Patescibacteria group bacterium]|nr:hypothetical protein [Patescibacteria group bacterium]
MNIAVRDKKSLQHNELRNEVRRLRSFVISLAGQDDEGGYRPEFVEGILRATREKPTMKFMGASDFLKQIKNG